MSEISLKAYEEEIDQLIDASQYLEALAHLRYILSQYPRYVEAYYRLGKMLLETDLPGFAADMFRRVLAVDPEHLEARIGLGIAHQQKDNIDAAIWNLERALELAPDSIEIMDELQRLYEDRDGVIHDRLFRTRAGLARLYLRAQLYARATRELRALLAEDPARPDLMTALAEAYWRDGQTVQAADLCQEILGKMPYHCKANLILGSLWINSGQDEGWDYLRRAEEVDPENRRALALLGEADVVEPHTVTLERLEYDPDALDVDRGSEWFEKLSSMSIDMGISEVSPEMTGEEMRLADITASLEAQIELPDWLRDLGLGEEEESSPAEVSASEETFTAEVSPPEESGGEGEGGETWLEGVAADVLTEEAPEPPEAGEAPDWLLELVEDADAAGLASAEGEDTVSPEAGEESWLEALQTVVSGELEPEEAIEGEQESWEGWDIGPEAESGELVAQQEEGLPDLLEGLEPSIAPMEEVAPPEQEEEVPDWLAELEIGEEEEGDAVSPSPSESLPDWLSELQPSSDSAVTSLVEDTEDQEIADLVEEILGEEEVPHWLSELDMEPDLSAGLETAVMEPSPTTEKGEGEQEAPVGEAAVEEAEAQESLEIPVEEEPLPPESEVPLTQAESLVSEGPTEVEAVMAGEPEGELLSGDEALAWPEELTAGREEELRAQVEAESAERVAELLGRGKTETEVTEAEIEPRQAEPTEPEIPEKAVEAETTVAEEEEGELLSGDEALAWLESLTAGREEELRAQVEAESEARVAELLGRRKPEEAEEISEAPSDQGLEVVEPETAISPPTTVIETPETEVAAEEAMLSVAPEHEAGEEEEEDTLAWLEGLAAGGETEGEEVSGGEVVAPAAEVETTAGLETEGELLSGDDALAWLESLASGHEEELRAQAEAESAERVAELLGRKEPEAEAPSPAVGEEISPLETLEEVNEGAEESPSWLQEVEQEDALEPKAIVEAPLAEEVAEAPAEIPAELPKEAAPEAAVPPEETEEPLPWLQEAEPESSIESETTVEAPPAEETVKPPEDVEAAPEPEETEELPPWLQEAEPEGGVESEVAVEAPPAEEAVKPPEDVEAAPEPEETEELPPWLQEAEPEGGVESEVAEAPPAEEATSEVGSEGQESTQEPAFVGWTAFGDEIVEVAPPEPEPEATLTEGIEAQIEETVPTEDALAWLGSLPPEKEAVLEAEIAPPAEKEVEATPPEAESPETVVEEPEIPAELEEVASPPTAEVETLAEAEEEVAPAETVRVSMAELEELRATVKRKRSNHDARLTLARALWEIGEIEESMTHYGRLIKSGAKTEEVQRDLERYVQMRPNDPRLLKTLGDTYMKSGDLEQALAIYNQAMDLL